MLKNEMRLELPCHMTDCAFRLRPASFMDLAQVAAMEGSRNLGFGYDRLEPRHKAWVLYRMHFKFLRPVLWRENISLETWHRGQEDLLFLRDYVLRGQDGEPAVLGTSSWVILDTRARSFVRNEDLPYFVDLKAQCDEAVFDFAPPKVNIPRRLVHELVSERMVVYSDIDFVGHTNNARYVAWAMDSIDQDWVSAHQVSEVTVNFNHETHLGEKISIFRCSEQTDSGRVFYVEGRVEGVPAFAVKLLYQSPMNPHSQ